MDRKIRADVEPIQGTAKLDITVFNTDDHKVVVPILEIYVGVRKWFRKEYEVDPVGLVSKKSLCQRRKDDEQCVAFEFMALVNNNVNENGTRTEEELREMLLENFDHLRQRFSQAIRNFFDSEYCNQYFATEDAGIIDDFLVSEGLRSPNKKRKKPNGEPTIVKYDNYEPVDSAR